jgi:Zn-dependent protease
MIHLGSIRGTSIDVDFSFIILIVFFVATDYNPALGMRYALLWAPVLFVSVLIHELAHAATIGAFGYGPSRIILGGMGGLTVNARKSRPWHDMVISLAGPFSSFALALIIHLVVRRVPAISRDPMLAVFLPILYTANMWWGEFNLLPITPLDGGQAVRNLLRSFLDERKAFVIAVWIGMVAGAAAAIAGALRHWYFFAILIGWFVMTNFQQWRHFREHGLPGD